MWRNDIEPYFNIYSSTWSKVVEAHILFLTLEGVHNLFCEKKKTSLAFKIGNASKVGKAKMLKSFIPHFVIFQRRAEKLPYVLPLSE